MQNAVQQCATEQPIYQCSCAAGWGGDHCDMQVWHSERITNWSGNAFTLYLLPATVYPLTRPVHYCTTTFVTRWDCAR